MSGGLWGGAEVVSGSIDPCSNVFFVLFFKLNLLIGFSC